MTGTQVLEDNIFNDPAYNGSEVAHYNSYGSYASPLASNDNHHNRGPGAYDNGAVVKISGVTEHDHDANYNIIEDQSVKSETEAKQIESANTEDFHLDRVHYANMIKIFQPLLLITVKVRHLIPYLPFLSDSKKVLAIEARNARAAMIYLLDELTSHRHTATQNWQQFVNALEKCGYRYIVEVLSTIGPVDHTYQREYVRIVSPILRQLITPSKLTPKLWAAAVITSEDKDDIARIERENGPVHATDSLLECLPRNHTYWYLHFIDALTENKVNKAVEILNIAEMKQYGGQNESVKQHSSSSSYLNMYGSEETACKQLVESSGEYQFKQSVNDTIQIRNNDSASSETCAKQVITSDESADSYSEWDSGKYEPPMPPFAAPNPYTDFNNPKGSNESLSEVLEAVNDASPLATATTDSTRENNLDCLAVLNESPSDDFDVVKDITSQTSPTNDRATDTNYKLNKPPKPTPREHVIGEKRCSINKDINAVDKGNDNNHECDQDRAEIDNRNAENSGDETRPVDMQDKLKNVCNKSEIQTEVKAKRDKSMHKVAIKATVRHSKTSKLKRKKLCSRRNPLTSSHIFHKKDSDFELGKSSPGIPSRLNVKTKLTKTGKHSQAAIAAGRKSLYYSEPFRNHRRIEDEDIFVTFQNPLLQQGIVNRSWDIIDEENYLRNTTNVSKQKNEEDEVHRLIEILNTCGQERTDISLKSNVAVKDVTPQNLNPGLRSKLEKVRDLEDKLENLMYDEKILRRRLKLQDDINEILKRNRSVSSELSLKEKEAMALEAAIESGSQETEADLNELQQEINHLDLENISSAHAAVTLSKCMIAEDLQRQAAGENEKECTDLYKDSAFCSQYTTKF